MGEGRGRRVIHRLRRYVRALTGGVLILAGYAFVGGSFASASSAPAHKTSCGLLSSSTINAVLGFHLGPVTVVTLPSLPGAPSSLAGTLTCNWGVVGKGKWANLVFEPESSSSWNTTSGQYKSHTSPLSAIVTGLRGPAYAFPVFGPHAADTLLYVYIDGELISVGAPASLQKVETLMKKVLASY